jgi:hypothetical protein
VKVDLSQLSSREEPFPGSIPIETHRSSFALIFRSQKAQIRKIQRLFVLSMPVEQYNLSCYFELEEPAAVEIVHSCFEATTRPRTFRGTDRH